MSLAPLDIARPAGLGMPTLSIGHFGATLGRAITIAGLAALAAGLMVGGIGSRLAMRLVTVLGDPADIGRLTEAQARVGDITLEGTAFLLVAVTVITTVVGAIAYVGVGPLLRGRPLARGLELGAILLLSLGSQVIQSRNFDFAQFATPAVTVGLFATLFVLFGIVTVLVAGWLERRLPGPGFRRPADAGYWAALVLGTGAVLLMVVSAVGSRADPVPIVAMIVMVGYAALARAAHEQLVTVFGWVIVAVFALPLGLALMGEVVEIIRDAAEHEMAWALNSVGSASAEPVPGGSPASCMAFISALAPFDFDGTRLTCSDITELMRAETLVERDAGEVGSHASRHAQSKFVSDLLADCFE